MRETLQRATNAATAQTTSDPSVGKNSALPRTKGPSAQSRGGGDVKWKKQPVNGDSARYWFIDMTRVFKGAHKVGYLYTRVYSPEDQPIRLELGSDDGLKVWLNGQNIHTNNALRGCQRAQDIVTTTLEKGMNELLVKVSNNGGGWAACVRVRAPDGGRLNGVYAKADKNPE